MIYHSDTSVTCVSMAKCNSIRVPAVALLGDGGPVVNAYVGQGQKANTSSNLGTQSQLIQPLDE